MKLKSYLSIVLTVATFSVATAGNPQRAGSAGASELLINPFALSFFCLSFFNIQRLYPQDFV
ncbi:MAG: hypothetical protein VW540_05875, partial [Gammaproteobacteria bacterium]